MEIERIRIVIPAWNEEATIDRVVRGVGSFGRVLVVDDASSDRTAGRAEAAGATVVRHDTNQGYVGALNTGFAAAAEAGAEYILTCDADGQHAGENLEEAIRLLEEGADLVAGVRPFRPRISEKLFARTFQWRYGARDPLCGLKGYNTRVYRDAGFFDRCNSYGADLLRYACSHRDRYRIVEMPVKIHDRADAPRVGNRLKANVSILKGMIRLYARSPA